VKPFLEKGGEVSYNHRRGKKGQQAAGVVLNLFLSDWGEKEGRGFLYSFTMEEKERRSASAKPLLYPDQRGEKEGVGFLFNLTWKKKKKA